MPVITTLQSLNKDDLMRILTEPKNSLIKQYSVLMSYDNVTLEFNPEALGAMPTELSRWRLAPGDYAVSWKTS